LLIASRHGQLLVKLTDLGIAREVADDASRLTGAGMIVGTIDYLAPEQARDSSTVDIRSDIYALGCTLYEMLSGQPPFQGSVTELVYKHSEEIPSDIRAFAPTVSPGLAFILGKMLEKKPEDRYQTPTELLVDLRRVGKLEPPPSSRAATTVPGPAPEIPQGLPEIISRRVRTEITQKKGTDEQTSSDRDTALIANPTPKQHRIAVGQFEKGGEAISMGNYDYGIPLLLNCCTLDPANLRYRQMLRQAGEAVHARQQRVNLGTTVVDWILKARVKAARTMHSHDKVLELCEQILVHEPGDFSAQFEAAMAAKELGLLNSALWMMERLRKQFPKSVEVLRELAGFYEGRKDFGKAIALWESIVKIDRLNGEAREKLQGLAANQAIHRGGYEEYLERPVRSGEGKSSQKKDNP
jgi:Protein kinase domain